MYQTWPHKTTLNGIVNKKKRRARTFLRALRKLVAYLLAATAAFSFTFFSHKSMQSVELQLS